MGTVDSIPVVSQAKSLVQLAAGDEKGAAQTFINFGQQCIGVSQLTSALQLINGDSEGALETQKVFLESTENAINNIVDSTPGLGHIKGAIHYCRNEKEEGDQAMKSASRTLGVIGGGTVGLLTAGPAGAVIGGILGGTGADTVTTVVESGIKNEFTPSGIIAAVKDISDKPEPGKIFDTVMIPVFDGVAGYTGGRNIAKNIKNTRIYSVMETSVADEAVRTQEIPLRGGSAKTETWFSESVKHQKGFLLDKIEKNPNNSYNVIQANVDKGYYNQMKSENCIPQYRSKAINEQLIREGQNPKNIFNTERLKNHKNNKVNIGVKCDANLEQLNNNISKIKHIDLDSVKYKNGLTKNVSRYGPCTAATIAEESYSERNSKKRAYEDSNDNDDTCEDTNNESRRKRLRTDNGSKDVGL